MSITFGNLLNEAIGDNRFKIGTYNNSNVIYINIDNDNYRDGIINFRNRSEIGHSNNQFVINMDGMNIFDASSNLSQFNNDLLIKSNLYTSNETTYINSNVVIQLTPNPLNHLLVNDSNHNSIIYINNSNIQANFNNSNKISINPDGITINDDMTIQSNQAIYVRNLRGLTPTTPILIDNTIISNLNIDGTTLRKYIKIINYDESYHEPTIFINKYKTSTPVFDIYTRTYPNSNTSNRIHMINENGYMGIGADEVKNPIDINIISSSNDYLMSYIGDTNGLYFKTRSNINYSNISNIEYSNLNLDFFLLNSNYVNSNFINNNNSNISNLNYYYNNSVDKFVITNRGYIGIGTYVSSNHLNICMKDDKRNIKNHPIINLDMKYDKRNNYRTSNTFDLEFIATRENRNILDENDNIINTIDYQFNNFTYAFSSNISFIRQSVEPVQNESVIINVSNMINNDYITNNQISNLINYNTYNHIPFNFNYNNIDYFVNYEIKLPSFLNIDLNEGVIINNEKLNPVVINDTTYPKYHNVTYTTYITKEDTRPPYNTCNLVLKEYKEPVFYLNSNVIDEFTIFLNQRLYIEKNIYKLPSFTDYKTFIYQPASLLLNASSNDLFVASLTMDGKLSLGDKAPRDNYYLYVDRQTRLNNLECSNISSVPDRKNIGFSYCNISNINRVFCNSNINNQIISSNGNIMNLWNSNMISSNMNILNFYADNLVFRRMTTSNLLITSNGVDINMKMVIGSNMNSNYDNHLINVNINSNNSNGIVIQSLYENINPSMVICGYSNQIYPYLRMHNRNIDYSIRLNNDNYNLWDNKNNRGIYRHINYPDNLNHHLTFGSSNHIIFDLKQEGIATNGTNKIALGYPYRYLLQNNLNINNWNQYFKDNYLNSDSMLNIYGNVNIATINNTPILKCSGTEFPNEVIGVSVGGATIRQGFIFNIEGNMYISSNINIQNDIYVKGTLGNVSDIRVKDNLRRIENAMDRLDKINGYIYTRKDTGKQETGLVAQEVEKILPEVINRDRSNEYLNISYGNMNGIIVEAIKELNNRLKRIEDKLFNNPEEDE
jgi:hypothetical protein